MSFIDTGEMWETLDDSPREVMYEGRQWSVYGMHHLGHTDDGDRLYEVVLVRLPGRHDDALDEEFQHVEACDCDTWEMR